MAKITEDPENLIPKKSKNSTTKNPKNTDILIEKKSFNWKNISKKYQNFKIPK